MTDELLLKKAKFYKEKARAVHIIKKNLLFNNGVILEVKGDFLIFEDERKGELPIFFEEIKDIEPREPKVRG